MADDVTVPSAPPLARIHGVELMRTGQWDISTGRVEFTSKDLAAAVGALNCPAVRRPVLKLGHTDARFDGQPAVGWVDNIATTDNGHTLVGDYVGMPGWLGQVIASAYPDRSIEGVYDYRCQLGHTHPFVLTAVALLGVTAPGIGTLSSLQDVAALYGVAAADDDLGGRGTAVQVTVRAAGNAGSDAAHAGAMVALVPSDADAERLAVDGGEPAGELHVTLMFLGDGADYTPEQQTQLTDAVRAAVADAGPVEGDGFAVSVFNPGVPDRHSCIVLGVGGAGLEPLHDAVAAAVDGAGLEQVPQQRSPWVPHLTLTYTDDATQVAALTDRVGSIQFDRVRVAFAGEHTDIPLTGDPVAASAGKDTAMPNPSPREVAAGVTTEDIRRGYYEDAPWDVWICEIQLNPLQLIVVDDRTGQYQRVPVEVTGDDTFDFGDPVPVVVRYVDQTSDGDVAASAAASGPIVYASRAESRPGAAVVAGAVPYRKTDVSDGAWSANKMVGRIPNDAQASVLKQMYAWVDPDSDADTKAAYKLPHHEVSTDGTVGAANVAACRSAIGVLNGARGGADIPDADRHAVYAHLAHHLKDADVEPPELADAGGTSAAASVTELDVERTAPTHEQFTGTRQATTAAAAEQPANETPGAEPDHNTTIEEDDMSTDLSGLRSALGLAEDADLEAITTAAADFKAKAEAEQPTDNTGEQPTPDADAGSAPAVDETPLPVAAAGLPDEAKQQIADLSSQLAAIQAERRANVKASLFDSAVKAGKIAPAERESWETRYDKAPEIVTEIVESISAGAAVPVAASGYTGQAEPEKLNDEFARLFPPAPAGK